MLDADRITLVDHGAYDLSASTSSASATSARSRLPFNTLERAVIFELHKSFRLELIGRFD